MSIKMPLQSLFVATGLALSVGIASAGPVNNATGAIGLNNGLNTLRTTLGPNGALAGPQLGNPADLLGVTVLENDNRGNSPHGIGTSVGSGTNTGNGGQVGVGVLAGRNAGNGGQIGVGILSEGNNGSGQAISLQLLNADTAIALALGGADVIPAQTNPSGSPVMDPLSGGSASDPLRAALGASGPIVGPIRDGMLNAADQLGGIPAQAQGSPIFGQLPPLPGLAGSGPITIALLGGQNSAAQTIAAGVITGPNTGNTGPDGVLGASAISSGSSGNGGDIGVGAITGSRSGNGQVVGVAALAGGNSNSGNGGTASVAVLSGNNSGTGASAANVGVLNGNNSANGGVANVGVLNGNNSANGGVANVGVLNGANSVNNGTTNVAVLNGPNSGGGIIVVGVLNPPAGVPTSGPGGQSALESCDERGTGKGPTGIADDGMVPTIAPSVVAAPTLVKTAFVAKLADKLNCENLGKAKTPGQQAASPDAATDTAQQ